MEVSKSISIDGNNIKSEQEFVNTLLLGFNIEEFNIKSIYELKNYLVKTNIKYKITWLNSCVSKELMIRKSDVPLKDLPKDGSLMLMDIVMDLVHAKISLYEKVNSEFRDASNIEIIVKNLQIEEKSIPFSFSQDGNFGKTNTIIDGNDIEIEILMDEHNQKEVDWQHFHRFLEFIDKPNRLKTLIEDSNPLITELGKAFFRRCLNEIENWEMKFNNSIIYNGKPDKINRKDAYSYSLCFDFFTVRVDKSIDGDAYGFYRVDIEDLAIVGARRT
jgi:hypothetical protein